MIWRSDGGKEKIIRAEVDAGAGRFFLFGRNWLRPRPDIPGDPGHADDGKGAGYSFSCIYD